VPAGNGEPAVTAVAAVAGALLEPGVAFGVFPAPFAAEVEGFEESTVDGFKRSSGGFFDAL
jgi:hypothetical protein